MSLDTTSLREAAERPARADRRAAPDVARVARGRQRAAGHPRPRARGDRGPAARRDDARDDERHRRHADRRRARPDDPAARRHGRPADARGHRARRSPPRSTARCTPAATTPTPPCSSARRGCSPSAATSSPAACCSCSSRARRATTAPASCSRRVCSTCRRSPTAARRRSAAAFAIHITSSFPSGWMSSRGGSIMASADTMTITVTGKGGHASEPHRARRPDPGRLRDRPGPAADGHPHRRRVRSRRRDGRPHHRRHDQQRDPGDGDDPRHHPAVSERTRSGVHDGIRRVVDGVAAAHGCEASVDIDAGYPVTVNDGAFADTVLDVAGQVVGADRSCASRTR